MFFTALRGGVGVAVIVKVQLQLSVALWERKKIGYSTAFGTVSASLSLSLPLSLLPLSPSLHLTFISSKRAVWEGKQLCNPIDSFMQIFSHANHPSSPSFFLATKWIDSNWMWIASWIIINVCVCVCAACLFMSTQQINHSICRTLSCSTTVNSR